MGPLMSALDRFLRWKDGVFELSHEDCILRIRLIEARRIVVLPEGQISAGAKVVGLHLWNERIPPLPGAGLDMVWAGKLHRRVTASCRLLARHLLEDPRFAGVQGLTGTTVLFFPGDRSAAERLFTRLGFIATPYQSSLGSFGEFWENVYSWMIMRASKAATRPPWQLRRTEVWISADEFIRRHSARGAASAARARRDDRQTLPPMAPSG